MNEALRQLEALLSGAAAMAPPFAANSRYHGVPTLQHLQADGRSVPYLTRRFIPATEPSPLASVHLVVQGDRLDLLASDHFGDPEQWWKIADANNTLHPETLTDRIGQALQLSTTEGFNGPMGGA